MDGGRIIYFIDQKKLTSWRFPTFWFEPTPQGLFMLQVAFGQSKYYSDNLSENIRRGVRQKLRRGEWLNLVPFGYENNPKIRNIEPHPTNARIVRRAFEEYAKGTHTLKSLGLFLAALGVVSRNGNFEPLVSPQLFEAVQKVLQEKSRPRKRRVKHDFPFTGLFRCAE